jgi:uncharacterized LabA/DUF88 family protein
MRVAFLVDGFNLYHSIRDTEKQFAGRPQRWLDLRAFCQDYVRHFGRNAVLEGVYYFSALAKHLQASNPGVVLRHMAYIDAITSTGVQVTLANFKARDKYVPFEHCTFRFRWLKSPIRLPLRGCTVMFQRAEEKETDVAIATKIFELLHTGAADAIVLVSGDTDLLPAIRATRKLFPIARVSVCFPFRRTNVDLKQAVPQSFKVRKEQYAKHQLPDPVVLPNGRLIHKPTQW